jgi:hypothetical protein
MNTPLKACSKTGIGFLFWVIEAVILMGSEQKYLIIYAWPHL